MKLYTCYSAANQILYDKYLLPSIKDPFEIVAKQLPAVNEGKESLYGTREFNLITLAKVEFILKALEGNWGETFIFMDVDMYFYGPVMSELLITIQQGDIYFQKDSKDGMICTGFFVCRANERVRRLWRDVKRLMLVREDWNDQDALNKILREEANYANSPKKIIRRLTRFVSSVRHHQLKWGYLSERFYTVGLTIGDRWVPGTIVEVPEDIIVHHANWTVGLQNKIALLEHVKDVMEIRRKTG